MNLIAFGADALFPGSGVLLRIWGAITGFAKKIPWQVWVGLAAVIAIWLGIRFIDHRGYERGKAEIAAHYDAKMQKATARINHAIVVLKSADTTMNLQSASIRAQASAQTARLAKAKALIAAADARAAGQKVVIADLQAAGARPIDGPVCKSLPEVLSSWH